MKGVRLVAVVASAFSLLVAETTLAAQPEAPPSATAQDLARLLVPKEKWALGLQQLGMVVQQNLEGHPGSKLQYPSDLPTRIRAEVEAALPYNDLLGMHAKELSSSYTEPELKELSGFFRTPVGKKWLEVQPKTTQAVTVSMQQRFDQKLPDVMKKLAQLAKPPVPAKNRAETPKKPSK